MSSELHKRQQSAKIKTNILIATGIPLIMLILVSVFILNTIRYTNCVKTTHTFSSIASIQKMVSELETRRTEYLVTGDEEGIKQLYETIKQLYETIFNIEETIDKLPYMYEKEKILHIRELIEKWFKLTELQIDSRIKMSQVTIEDIKLLIMDESGKEIIDRANNLLEKLEKSFCESVWKGEKQLAKYNQKRFQVIIAITLLAIIISLSTSFYIARKLTMTLSGELHQKKQVFMQDSLSRQPEVKHGDEIARIAGALDTSAGELSKMAGLIQQLADSIKK